MSFLKILCQFVNNKLCVQLWLFLVLVEGGEGLVPHQGHYEVGVHCQRHHLETEIGFRCGEYILENPFHRKTIVRSVYFVFCY